MSWWRQVGHVFQRYLELYASGSGRPRGLEAWRDSSMLLITAVVDRGRGWKQVDAVVAP